MSKVIVDQFGQQGVDEEAGKKEESVVAVATVDEDEASRAENKQHEALSDKDEDDEEDDGHGKRHRKPGDGGDEGPGKKKVGQVLFWFGLFFFSFFFKSVCSAPGNQYALV